MQDNNLADPDAPLIVNGREVQPSASRSLPLYVQIPTNQEAVRELTRARKTIEELPIPNAGMNTIAVILYYTLEGVITRDIATITGLDIKDIEQIKKSEAFRTAQNNIIEQVVELQKEEVAGLINSSAKRSVERVITTAEANIGTPIGLGADKLLLEQYNNKNQIAAMNPMSGGLHIHYHMKDKDEKTPTIDVTPIKVTDDD